MIWKLIIICVAFMLSETNLQSVDVYEIDLSGTPQVYKFEKTVQPNNAYRYQNQKDYYHVYPRGGYFPDPDPEPIPQYHYPIHDPIPEPAPKIEPVRRPEYKPIPNPNYLKPIRRNEVPYNPPPPSPPRFPQPSYINNPNDLRSDLEIQQDNPQNHRNERDEIDITFGEQVKKLIADYVLKKFNTLNPSINSSPRDPNNNGMTITLLGADEQIMKEMSTRPSRQSMTDEEMMNMMVTTDVFFHGLTLNKQNNNNSAQCPYDPSVDVVQRVQYIFENSNTDTIKDTSCFYACEFEKIGLMKDNQISNKGMMNLINVMYKELPSPRIMSYIQRMMQCLQALGNYGDRCNTASKLLLCGFMKQTKIASCMRGFTWINGQRRCATETIFEDTFDGNTLDRLKWKQTIKISSIEDEEFVVYDNHEDNIYVANGQLTIRPTLMDDETVATGKISLKKCTGHYGSPECTKKAESFNILPPVRSAQITSSAYFTYGIINVRARLPQGDWIVPQIWLEPKNREYGPLLNSGRVLIGKCNGNQQLMDDQGNDIGIRSLKSGIALGSERNIRFDLGEMNVPPGWHDDFHNFTLFWDEDGMTFSVDNKVVKVIGRTDKEPISDLLQFSRDEISSTWPDRKRNTPFNEEFRLKLGVSVGGNMEFPDNSMTGNSHKKPWDNKDSTKALLNFWKDRNNWHKTWDPERSALVVDHVKITALK